MKTKSKILLIIMCVFATMLMLTGTLIVKPTNTAYAAGGTEVTIANVICQQYSYMDAGNYSGGSMYDTPPVEITNITLATGFRRLCYLSNYLLDRGLCHGWR